MCWPVRRDRSGEPITTGPRTTSPPSPPPIAAFEPVIMVAPTVGRAERCREALLGRRRDGSRGGRDADQRFVGPRPRARCTQSTAGGRPVVVDFVFNAWGEKFTPYDDDALLARRWADERGEQVRTSTMVLEGGAIAVDGQGTLVTTEQCLLHPNRNPSMGRSAMTDELATMLGTTTRRVAPPRTGPRPRHRRTRRQRRRLHPTRASCSSRGATTRPSRITTRLADNAARLATRGRRRRPNRSTWSRCPSCRSPSSTANDSSFRTSTSTCATAGSWCRPVDTPPTTRCSD